MACGIPMRRTGGLKLYLTPCAGLRRALTCPPPHAHLNTKTNTQQTIDMRTATRVASGPRAQVTGTSCRFKDQLPLQAAASRRQRLQGGYQMKKRYGSWSQDDPQVVASM